ncbi:SSB protein [Vibrio phage vB_VhaP_PG11]|nr:SSB protein [Vibrio phage vB_VhaP_PG11]
MIAELALGEGVKVEEDKDVLGGGNAVLPSGVYPLVCDYVYLEQTAKGALMAYGSFTPEGGRSIRFSECIMSKKSGKLKPTYTCKKEGIEKPLPGYSKVLHLFKACGIEIADLSGAEVEKKILKLYSHEHKKELNQEKQVLVQLTGAALQGGVRRILETKMNKNETTGEYDINSGEDKKPYNEIFKWFNVDGQTIEEAAEGKPAKFKEDWVEMYGNKDLDRRKKSDVATGTPALGGQAPQAGGGLVFDQ